MSSLRRAGLGLLLTLGMSACSSPADGESEVASSRSAIVGGNLVASGAWPNVVWLENGCSGVLVHERVLLYAAHCGEEHSRAWVGDAVQIEWDETGVTGFVPLGDTHSLELEVCRTHPEGGRGHDIAYCVLKEPAPIAVAPIAALRAEISVGVFTALVGFGMTDVEATAIGEKRSVEAPVAALSKYGEIIIGDDRAGSCYGDSGGPAFVRVGSASGESGQRLEWRLLGVLSGGEPGVCGEGYYTNIVDNLSFLRGAGFVLTACGDDRSAACVDAEPNADGLFDAYGLAREPHTPSCAFRAAQSAPPASTGLAGLLLLALGWRRRKAHSSALSSSGSGLARRA